MRTAVPLIHLAVNARFIKPSTLEGIGRFSLESIRSLADARPELRISLLFDHRPRLHVALPDNCEVHVAPPPARHPVLYHIWFQWSVAKLLKQLQPQVFLSPDGYLCHRTAIPQVPVVHDLGLVHDPSTTNWAESHYWLWQIPKGLKRAARVLTVSEFTKQDLLQAYPFVPAEQVDVVYNGVDEALFGPADKAAKLGIRQAFSMNQPYFLYVGAIQPRKNLGKLMEAFDAFKAQSDFPHKLLITGRHAWQTQEVQTVHSKMQHKADVVFTGYVSDIQLSQLYAGAEALTYVSSFEGFGLPLVEAMRCETALITSNVSAMPEVAGEAALLVDPHSTESIRDAMAQLAQDPALRERLIEKGRQRQQAFTWAQTAERMGQSLERAIQPGP